MLLSELKNHRELNPGETLIEGDVFLNRGQIMRTQWAGKEVNAVGTYYRPGIGTLVIGEYYRNRNGELKGPVVANNTPGFPNYPFRIHSAFFRANGSFRKNSENWRDLVEHVPVDPSVEKEYSTERQWLDNEPIEAEPSDEEKWPEERWAPVGLSLEELYCTTIGVGAMSEGL